MEIDQTKAFADALEQDMQFMSNMSIMLRHPAYDKLKDNPEAVKIAFSRLCTGTRWLWANFLMHQCPEAWAFWDKHQKHDDSIRYNVRQCIQDLREWGKAHGYDVGDGSDPYG